MEELPYACYSATQLVPAPSLPRASSVEASPYSSCIYQSIEGLTFAPQQNKTCNNCATDGSSITSIYSKFNNKCTHLTSIPRPQKRVTKRHYPDFYGLISPSHSPPSLHNKLLNDTKSACPSIYGGSIRSDPGGILTSPNDSSKENSGGDQSAHNTTDFCSEINKRIMNNSITSEYGTLPAHSSNNNNNDSYNVSVTNNVTLNNVNNNEPCTVPTTSDSNNVTLDCDKQTKL